MKYFLISDYLPDEVLGGCEINNEQLAALLRLKGHQVVEEKSCFIDVGYVRDNQSAFFIVSNFIELSDLARQEIMKCRYIIYEHDHKYLKSRNPATHKGLRAPCEDVVNRSFYERACAVICQSRFHADTLYKNLGLQNIISVGGNLWREEILDHLEKCSTVEKNNSVAILNSPIWHKNTAATIEHCMNKGSQYQLVSSSDQKTFISLLARNDTYMFFPKTPETLSRVACEARMLGMKVVTNGLVAATKEEWFSKKGKPLIEVMRQKRKDIPDLVENIFLCKDVGDFYRPQDKKVSIIMPAYNDEKYVAEALDDLLSQTYSNLEIIIVDDGSTDKTPDICGSYSDKYDCVTYYKKENGGTGSALNYGFKRATGDYGTWVSSDDRRSSTCIERMVNALQKEDVELVFTAYHSERFNRAWRSYTPDASSRGYKWEQSGFIHDSVPSKKVFLVDNWVDINLACCHSGVSFLFSMDLKKRSGEYLTVPGEDYHMEVKMGMLAKGNKVAYIDEVLGWHRFPPASLTSTNPACVLDAERITKSMIVHWKETGEINA